MSNVKLADNRRAQTSTSPTARELATIESLSNRLDTGLTTETGRGIAFHQSRLENSPSVEIRHAFEKILFRYRRLLEIECIYGFGSVLNLDHPLVKALRETYQEAGIPTPDPDRYKTAEAFHKSGLLRSSIPRRDVFHIENNNVE